MIEIMSHHQEEYVPSVEEDCEFFIESTGENLQLKKSQSHKILFGGDQLTVARARSAQQNVVNSDSDRKKLVGLIPVVEDWHTKLNLLSVSLIYSVRFSN